jgi:hypothetical protein
MTFCYDAPTEWDQDTDMLNDEKLSATSHEEASKVLEQWQADQDQVEEIDDIMEVDEQIGSNLLCNEIFDAQCVFPTGELGYIKLEDDDPFFAPLLDSKKATCTTKKSKSPHTSTSISLPFEERYQLTLKKLEESMKRSQETRKSVLSSHLILHSLQRAM